MDTTTTTTSVSSHAEELASMIGHRFLQNSAININNNNNSTAESSDFLDYLHDHTFAFFGFVVGGIIVILIIYCVIREWLIHKYGYECCAPTGERGERAMMSRSRHLQYLDDQQLAIDLQTEIEQEDRKATLGKQRKERRAKYEKFLVPYTMTVKDGDVCDAAALKEQNIVEKQSTMNISTDFDKKVDRSSTELTTVKEIDGGTNDVDLEAATIPSSHTISTPMSPKIDYENDNLEMERERVLQLPVKDDEGKLRHVDAECAICLLEYETGDSVVWSTRKVCKHAFHDECILVWLSKGKKRCPICRHFFVPGSSIDDKKVITHDENDEEAYINGSTLYEDMESDEDPLAASVDTVDGETAETENLEECEGSQRSASERILFRRLSREVLA